MQCDQSASLVGPIFAQLAGSMAKGGHGLFKLLHIYWQKSCRLRYGSRVQWHYIFSLRYQDQRSVAEAN